MKVLLLLLLTVSLLPSCGKNTQPESLNVAASSEAVISEQFLISGLTSAGLILIAAQVNGELKAGMRCVDGKSTNQEKLVALEKFRDSIKLDDKNIFYYYIRGYKIPNDRMELILDEASAMVQPAHPESSVCPRSVLTVTTVPAL